MDLIFATHNKHKAEEVEQMMPGFKLKTLNDIGFHDEIIEDGNTFKENAEIKTDAIIKVFNGNIFADDSGLVIPALNDSPGIHSSRYAGTGKSEDNIAKVLSELKNINNREAYFITVICLMFNGTKYFFEGKCHGTILTEIKGENGFGYDPIFQPVGLNKTFAELSPEIKNKISHRALAIQSMYDFIKN